MKKLLSIVLLFAFVCSVSSVAYGGSEPLDVVKFAEVALYRLLQIEPEARLSPIHPVDMGEAPDRFPIHDGFMVSTSVGTVFMNKGSLEVQEVEFYLRVSGERSQKDEDVNKLFAGVTALEHPDVNMDKALNIVNIYPLKAISELVSTWFRFTNEQKAQMMKGIPVLVHSSDEWDYKANYLFDDETKEVNFVMISATPRKGK